MEQYRTHQANANAADWAYQTALGALNKLRKEIEILARALAYNLRIILRHKADPAIRNVLRRFGYSFREQSGEGEETAEPIENPPCGQAENQRSQANIEQVCGEGIGGDNSIHWPGQFWPGLFCSMYPPLE